MIAVDTSALLPYLAGERGSDLDTIDEALERGTAVLPPVVLTEVLCAQGLTPPLRRTLLALPIMDISDGFWARAGTLRGKLLLLRFKARLADTLIAQSCIDHRVALVTRDKDFRHFARHGGLRLA
jgi:predicted nucleic acid-binding protein